MALAVGDKAPDFILTTEDEDTKIQLSKLRGKKVVLYFYPKDNTPGCTKEACDFRDHQPSFAKKNVIVLGVSKDSSKSHMNFKNKYSLSFPLLVDDKGEVCRQYDIFKKKSMFGKTYLGIQRTTYVIDENGIIAAVWNNVKVPGHVEQVLNELS